MQDEQWTPVKEVLEEFIQYLNENNDNFEQYAANCDNKGWNDFGDGNLYKEQRVADMMRCRIMSGALWFANGSGTNQAEWAKKSEVEKKEIERLRCEVAHVFGHLLKTMYCKNHGGYKRGVEYAWQAMRSMKSAESGKPGTLGGPVIEGKCTPCGYTGYHRHITAINLAIAQWLMDKGQIMQEITAMEQAMPCNAPWTDYIKQGEKPGHPVKDSVSKDGKEKIDKAQKAMTGSVIKIIEKVQEAQDEIKEEARKLSGQANKKIEPAEDKSKKKEDQSGHKEKEKEAEKTSATVSGAGRADPSGAADLVGKPGSPVLPARPPPPPPDPAGKQGEKDGPDAQTPGGPVTDDHKDKTTGKETTCPKNVNEETLGTGTVSIAFQPGPECKGEKAESKADDSEQNSKGAVATGSGTEDQTTVTNKADPPASTGPTDPVSPAVAAGAGGAQGASGAAGNDGKTVDNGGNDVPPPLNPPKPKPNPDQSGSSGSFSESGSSAAGGGAAGSGGGPSSGNGSTGTQTPGSSGPGSSTVQPKQNVAAGGGAGAVEVTPAITGGGLTWEDVKPYTPAIIPALVGMGIMAFFLWKYFAYLAKRRRTYRTVRDVPSPPLDEEILQHLQRGELPPPDYGYTVVRDRPPASAAASRGQRPPRVHKRTIIELHLEVLHECEAHAWENVKDDYLQIVVQEFAQDLMGDAATNNNILGVSTTTQRLSGTHASSTVDPPTESDGTDASSRNAEHPAPWSCVDTTQLATDRSLPNEEDPDPWSCMETIHTATEQRPATGPERVTSYCINWINWIDRNKHILRACTTQPWFLQLTADWKQYVRAHMAQTHVYGHREFVEAATPPMKKLWLWKQWVAQQHRHMRMYGQEEWFQRLLNNVEEETVSQTGEVPIAEKGIEVDKVMAAEDVLRVRAAPRKQLHPQPYMKKQLSTKIWTLILALVIEQCEVERSLQDRELHVDALLQKL
ncbi:hypothetical protein AK88_05293 [Plasmodium fragile]|uniref:Schizont-infected cell agglutination C-terminal domain-containing protein n=1 Tax=Plasmodium fragile TaxID=5857 RepID=A0A0D9QH95_PLAFR|nr:uncharacterized protein AK88_05293 [Plasmodium fragile]KJP85071.1 hypothetical protein AK88_05293 [Plasmodium fragile]